MWPFHRKRVEQPTPSIHCDGVDVRWIKKLGWEFHLGGVCYTLYDNPVFNPSLLTQLEEVSTWIAHLDSEIDKIVEQHAPSNGIKELIAIDVSWLVEKRQVEVEFVNEEWGDLGIGIVINDGVITDSFAGD